MNPNLFVGWLDLKPDDYRKYGYPTKEEWVKDINDLNAGLQKYMKDYLTSFVVIGAGSAKERISGNAYAISFSNIVIDPQTSIVTDVEIKDATTGKTIKKFAGYGTSFHMSYSMYTFAGRLNNSCYALAYEIYMQMTD